MSPDALVTIDELKAAVRTAAEAEVGELVNAIAERVAEVHGLAAADVRGVVEKAIDIEALTSRVATESEGCDVHDRHKA